MMTKYALLLLFLAMMGISGQPAAAGNIIYAVPNGDWRLVLQRFEPQAIKGSDGKPVPVGQIYFDPDPMKGGSGPQGVAEVKDGQFDTAKAGKGVRGGGYVVRVSGFDGKAANEAPQGKPLFNQYEFKKDFPKERSELKIEVPKQ